MRAAMQPCQCPQGNRAMGRARHGGAVGRDAAPGQGRHQGQPRHIAKLALVGRHAQRRVALEMLDGAKTLAMGNGDILVGHIMLKIDKSPFCAHGLTTRFSTCSSMMATAASTMATPGWRTEVRLYPPQPASGTSS